MNLHSTALEDDLDIFPPNQELYQKLNKEKEEEERNKKEDELNTLKATVASLKIEVQKKEDVIRRKGIDLNLLMIENNFNFDT